MTLENLTYDPATPFKNGGMSVLYIGKDNIGRQVIIKEVPLNKSEDAKSLFLKEGKNLAALKHEGLPAIHESFTEGDNGYLVMEYVPGQTLDEYVNINGSLKREEAIKMIKSVSEIIAYCHSQDVIHRDVKPSNIMILPDGSIKIVDFGISSRIEHGMTRLMTSASAYGSEGYASPEQYLPKSIPDTRMDIYALGGVLYFLLTGKHPPDALERKIEQVVLERKNIDEDLFFAINTAMELNLQDRPKSVDKFLKILEDNYLHMIAFINVYPQGSSKDVDNETEIFYKLLARQKSIFNSEGYEKGFKGWVKPDSYYAIVYDLLKVRKENAEALQKSFIKERKWNVLLDCISLIMPFSVRADVRLENNSAGYSLDVFQSDNFAEAVNNQSSYSRDPIGILRNILDLESISEQFTTRSFLGIFGTKILKPVYVTVKLGTKTQDFIFIEKELGPFAGTLEKVNGKEYWDIHEVANVSHLG